MVIISLSSFHQKVRFDCVFPIEIPLFHENILFHFKLSGAYFEGVFESCAPDVVPAGAFWELEIWLFEFFKPLFTLISPYFPLFALICLYLPLITLRRDLIYPYLPLFTLAQRPYLPLSTLTQGPYSPLFTPTQGPYSPLFPLKIP